MTEPVIAFEKVLRTYGRGQAAVHALAGVDFEVLPGEFVAVMTKPPCSGSRAPR